MHSFPMCKVNRFFFLFVASVALISAGLLVGCQQDQLPTDALSSDLPFVISDGTDEYGNPDFFFLPPLVPNPSGHDNWDDGGFNPNHSPEVRICQGHVEQVCAGLGAVARFTMTVGTGSEVVRLSEEDEHYIVNWHTDDVQDEVEKRFRIFVLVNEAVLGFADVELVSKQMKNRNTGEIVPLKDGRTVPIKFRIEYTLCDPDDEECTEAIVSASQDNLIQHGNNNFFLPAQEGDSFYVYVNNQVVAVPSLVYSISSCGSGLAGATVSECLTIEPDKPLARPLENPATVSFCELAWDPASLFTVFRRDDQGAQRPLPHADDFCEEEEELSQAELTGLWKYARAGLELLQRPIARLLAPTPLHADPPVLLHRGKGGMTDFTSDFQVLDLGQMDKFPGLLSWWPADSHFYDIYGESIDPEDPVYVGRNDASPMPDVGDVVFATDGIYNEAFNPAWTVEGDRGYLEAPANGLDPDVDELTVSAWAKLNSLPSHSTSLNLIALIDDATESVPVELGVGGIAGELSFGLKTEGGCGESSYCSLIAAGVMQTSCFHHVAGTFDGSDMVLYLDGQEVGRETVNAAPNQIVLPEGTEFQFGPLDGLLDEITVYRAALSGEDIQSIYAAGGEGKCEPPAGYTVSGTVYYSTTELAGFTVALEQEDVPLQTTTTDNSGYYAFESVQPGDYRIKTYGGGDYIGWYSSPIQVVSSDLTVDRYLPKNIVLLTPENGANVVSPHPTLTWTPNAEADLAEDYRIQINDTDAWDPTFETGASTTANYTVQTAMTPGENYTWQVDAYDVNSHWVGSTQMAFNFTVGMVLDQANDPVTGTSYGCPTLSSLYQSFTSLASSLGAVELRLRAGGSFPSGGTNTTINIRDGSPTASILATATTFVSDVSGQTLVTFPLSSALAVTPGVPLLIEWLTTGDAILTWMGSDDDPYPGGTAFGCSGTAVTARDMNFRTYAPYTP